MTIRTLSVVVLLLSSCRSTQSPSITHLRGGTMGTSYSIKMVLPAGVTRDQSAAKVQESLGRFDLLFSTYNPASEISRFNRYRDATPFAASTPFTSLVRRALSLAKQTDGCFDPTIGPLLRLYGRGPGAEKVDRPPSDAAIQAVLPSVGWQRLQVEANQISKDPSRVELDLNAIAKGAGVDTVASTLDQLGCSSYMVEIGGEVRCRGSKPNGTPWRLGITNPDQPGFADKVNLIDAAMATSGSYQQYQQFGRTRVHHILDAKTGRNAINDLVSVTVIAPTCARADGLATALMVAGPKRGNKFLDTLADPSIRVLYLLAKPSGIHHQTHNW